MAQLKQCTCCFKTLPYEMFSKNSKAKDGKQFHCKECNKKENLKFRTEINPQHHEIWQSNNRKRATELVTKYRKGDKPGKIYYIVNPEGEYYIGMTNTPMSVRIMEHRTKWKRFNKGVSKIHHPLLFASLDKWGWEGHRTGVIIEDENVSRTELRKWERECIGFFMSKGKSLNAQL